MRKEVIMEALEALQERGLEYYWSPLQLRIEKMSGPICCFYHETKDFELRNCLVELRTLLRGIEVGYAAFNDSDLYHFLVYLFQCKRFYESARTEAIVRVWLLINQ